MKKNQLLAIVFLVTTNLIMAGGDISSITTFEVEDVSEIMVEPIPKMVITPAPEPIVVPAIPKVVLETPKVLRPAPVVVSTTTSNKGGIYAGIGVIATRYNTNCVCSTSKSGVDKTAGVMGKVGYNFNEYMGVEARGMVTALKDDGGKVQHYGVFVKPSYPATDSLSIYGLGGFAKTKTIGTLRTADLSGLALGGGLEYGLSSFDVFADYERLYYKKGSPDLDAVSIGISYDF